MVILQILSNNTTTRFLNTNIQLTSTSLTTLATNVSCLPIVTKPAKYSDSLISKIPSTKPHSVKINNISNMSRNIDTEIQISKNASPNYSSQITNLFLISSTAISTDMTTALSTIFSPSSLLLINNTTDIFTESYTITTMDDTSVSSMVDFSSLPDTIFNQISTCSLITPIIIITYDILVLL